MPVEEQIAVIYAGVNRHLDDIPVERVGPLKRATCASCTAAILKSSKTSGRGRPWTRDAGPFGQSIAEFKKSFAQPDDEVQ